MKLTVNGEVREFPSPLTVAGLIESLGHAGLRVAVEVNRDIVPRSRHGEHLLNDGDRVEVVRAIGGG
jgi:sulfur carrier protein